MIFLFDQQKKNYINKIKDRSQWERRIDRNFRRKVSNEKEKELSILDQLATKDRNNSQIEETSPKIFSKTHLVRSFHTAQIRPWR